MGHALTQAGIRTSDSRDADFTVLLATSIFEPRLADHNRTVLDAEHPAPWLPATTFDGKTAWIGPLLIPGSSACYTCFLLRRTGNFGEPATHAELLDLRGLPTSIQAVSAHPISMVQAGMMAAVVAEWLALRDYAPMAMPGGTHRLITDSQGINIQRSRVLRVQRCPDCSPVHESGSPQVWFHRADTDHEAHHPVNPDIGVPQSALTPEQRHV